MRIERCAQVVGAIGGVLAACSALIVAVVARGAELPGPLVGPDWLAAHRADVVVLDVRARVADFTAEPQYAADPTTGRPRVVTSGGHIAGALLIDFARVRATRIVDGHELDGMLPDAGAFESAVRAAGLQAGKPIVIVTPATTPEELDMAARVYWSFKVFGADDLAILDGGLARWLDEGRAVVTAAPPAVAGDWRAGTPRVSLVADSDRVAGAAAAGTQLVDARPAPFYFGLTHRPNIAAAGHIAGARNFPPDLRARLVGTSQRFLSPAEYRFILGSLGVRADEPVVTYCNTGHMAAGAWFVISELLGNSRAAVYDGSLMRWSSEGRPVVAAP